MNKKLFQRCINLSKDLAKFDAQHAQRHFSYICYRNKIVCTGINDKWRSDPLANKFGHRFNSVHSEIAVIKACPFNWRELNKFTIVNIRLNRSLEVMSAKSCKHCQKMLEWFDVGEVWYSINSNEWGQSI